MQLTKILKMSVLPNRWPYKLLSGLKDACVLGIILWNFDSLNGLLAISGIAVFSASSLYELSKAKQLWTARKQQEL